METKLTGEQIRVSFDFKLPCIPDDSYMLQSNLNLIKSSRDSPNPLSIGPRSLRVSENARVFLSRSCLVRT